MANPIQQILGLLTGMQAQLTAVTPQPTNDTTFELPKKGELLHLPPEVRVMIFKYVVVSHKPLSTMRCFDLRPIATEDGDVVERVVSRTLPAEPAVAATSKQMRSEVLPLFYEQNEFIFEPIDRNLPFADWYERLPRPYSLGHGLPLYHISTVILKTRTTACRRSPLGSPHSHNIRVTIKQQPGKDLSVELGDAAAGQCTCCMVDAYWLWAENSSWRKEKHHVTAMAKDIEWLEFRSLKAIRCLSAEVKACGTCGLPRPREDAFGKSMLDIHAKTYKSVAADDQCTTS